MSHTIKYFFFIESCIRSHAWDNTLRKISNTVEPFFSFFFFFPKTTFVWSWKFVYTDNAMFALFGACLWPANTCHIIYRFASHQLIRYMNNVNAVSRSTPFLFLFFFFFLLFFLLFVGPMQKCVIFVENTAAFFPLQVIRRYFWIGKGKNWWEWSPFRGSPMSQLLFLLFYYTLKRIPENSACKGGETVDVFLVQIQHICDECLCSHKSK